MQSAALLQQAGPQLCPSSGAFRRHTRRRSGIAAPRCAVAESAAAPAKGELLRPPWAGGGWQTELVNSVINCKPLFARMKVAAKNHLKKTASLRGIGWDENIAELQAQLPVLEQLKREVELPGISYPDYYLQEFHAYEEGNLNWMAAFEVEPATEVTYVNAWKAEKTLPVMEARQRMRGGFVSALQDFRQQQGAREAGDILDIGCSVGASTHYLRESFPDASILGLDASPHFLAVAELRERERQERTPAPRRIQYTHALMEDTGLPAASQDVVSSQFVVHECIPEAITAMVKEAVRVLRPGGVLMVCDNDPQSKAIQNLPKAIAALMKCTEPWSDQYYMFDMEACFREAGLCHVNTVATDPRHRAVLGMVSQ
mmetsp:Transcript_5164/g.14839  ORF Transcript_5164/g.14839 Transcript_5164/m.14839 type:complete len:372 (-) Transcript_5164:486-1601(-)